MSSTSSTITPARDSAAIADVTTYFEKLKSQHLDTLLRGMNGTCRFDIESAGSWLLVLHDGYVAVRQTAEPADSEVRCTAPVLLSIVHGEQNAFTAALQGRLHVSGSLALVQILGHAVM